MDDLKVFELDLKMANPNNKCYDEKQVAEEGQNWFRMDYSPFYGDSLEVRNLIGQILVPDTEYTLEGYDPIASQKVGAPVYNFVVTKVDVKGGIITDYHTLGECSTPISKISQIVDDIIHNKNPIDYETQVVGKPDTFPGFDHYHYTSELSGFYFFIADAIKQAEFYKTRTQKHWFENQSAIVALATGFVNRRAAYLAKLHSHDTAYGNEHHLTKADLGFDLLSNHALATPEIDLKGVSRDHFSTPGGLGEVIKNNRYYPALNVRPGSMDFNQYRDEDHTQFITIETEKPELYSLAGFWQPTMSGGVSIINNYTQGGKHTARWCNYGLLNGLVFPYTIEDNTTGVVNSTDGKVKLYQNSAGNWRALILDTGLDYQIETASIPKRSDVYKNAVVGIKNENLYLISVYYDTLNSPSLEVHWVSVLNKPNGSRLRLTRMSVSVTHEDGSVTPAQDYVDVFSEITDQGKVIRLGRVLPSYDQLFVSEGCLLMCSFDTSDNSLPIKVVQPIRLTIDGNKYYTALEQCLSLDVKLETAKTEYEAQRQLNIDLTLKELTEYVDNKVEKVYEAFFKVINKGIYGSSMGLLSSQHVLVFGEPEACFELTVPYTRSIEVVSRPWIPYLDNSSITPIKANLDYDSPEDRWEFAAPAIGRCFLNGMKLVIDDEIVDVQRAYHQYGVTEYTIYLGIKQTYARHFVHPDATLTRPGLMAVATVKVDPDIGITSLVPIKDI